MAAVVSGKQALTAAVSLVEGFVVSSEFVVSCMTLIIRVSVSNSAWRLNTSSVLCVCDPNHHEISLSSLARLVQDCVSHGLIIGWHGRRKVLKRTICHLRFVPLDCVTILSDRASSHRFLSQPCSSCSPPRLSNVQNTLWNALVESAIIAPCSGRIYGVESRNDP